jgi:hypothetical protein
MRFKFFSRRLFVFFSTGKTVAGRDGVAGRARLECGLYLYIHVWGKLGFVLIFFKILSKMLVNGKE